MAWIGVTYDMWGPGFAEVPLWRHYAEMLGQCEYADRHGIDIIAFNEHHATDDGYIPSPLSACAAVAARTSRVTIRPLLLLPLYDIVRLAGDAAVIDNIAGPGRFEIVLGAGYRAEEFAMFGRDRNRRRAEVDAAPAFLRQAWTGDSFAHDGRAIRVTPRPATPGGPKIWMGGSSPKAARAAAQLADGFFPVSPLLWPPYREECLRLDKEDPGPIGGRSPMFVHISETPDADWPKIAPYLLNGISQYRGWNTGQQAVPPQFAIEHEADLRASPDYRVVTPDETVALIRALGPGGQFILRPMWGGYDPALGWSSLRLLAERVLPQLAGEPR